MNPQVAELLTRLVAVGPVPKLTASEYHEIFDYVDALEAKVKELEAHRKRIEYLGALEKQRMLDSGNDCDHLVLALDGRTCWGETFIEAVDNAMRHDGLLNDKPEVTEPPAKAAMEGKA